jgi:hypothetical protein
VQGMIERQDLDVKENSGKGLSARVVSLGKF